MKDVVQSVENKCRTCEYYNPLIVWWGRYFSRDLMCGHPANIHPISRCRGHVSGISFHNFKTSAAALNKENDCALYKGSLMKKLVNLFKTR